MNDTPVPLPIPRHLETQPLNLRCPVEEDGPAIQAAIVSSWPELSAWIQWARDGITSLDATTQRAASRAVGFEDRTEFNFAAFEKLSGRFVGKFSIFDLDWSVPRAETGYWLATPMVGHGYASEALVGITNFAQSLGIVRVELRTHADNARSRALAERCGYELEGILRNQRRCPQGKLADTCVYAQRLKRSDTASSG
jgi:ribosomal-protein-serine acetyltransferase